MVRRSSHTRATVIRFCVSVPVLSVHTTVVAPSASIAPRCRTRTFRVAMRREAMASDSVTVGSRPSGTLATMMPMPKMKFWTNGQADQLADQEERDAEQHRQHRHHVTHARDVGLQARRGRRGVAA